jgi:hypothetical protein
MYRVLQMNYLSWKWKIKKASKDTKKKKQKPEAVKDCKPWLEANHIEGTSTLMFLNCST